VVPATIRRQSSSADGLQPLRLARDWHQVITLIEVAFGEALDADAQRALRNMRPLPGLAPLIGFFDNLALPGEGLMPGFVWLEGGKVVGTASMRRMHSYDDGWLISNVAVHPDWQRRGIGRAVVEASLDFAQDHGGRWTVLQVRDDNATARRLYESLGFQSVGEVVRLRKADARETIEPVPVEGLRPANWTDGSALYSVARTLTPYDVLWADAMNRDLYKTGPLEPLVTRLNGRRRRWWVQAGTKDPQSITHRAEPRVRSAVGVEVNPSTPWHRLRLLVSPKSQDHQLAAGLITFGLSQLADDPALPVEIEHPASGETVQSALAEVGFERKYALIHMRLNL
jgi:ribosomal protein S18 acetylase RimI-like enzyme